MLVHNGCDSDELSSFATLKFVEKFEFKLPHDLLGNLHSYDKIERLITHMPKLRKLKLTGGYASSIKIVSNTLEEVYMGGGKGFFRNKVECPSLKLFRFRGGLAGMAQDPSNDHGDYDNRDVHGRWRAGDVPFEG